MEVFSGEAKTRTPLSYLIERLSSSFTAQKNITENARQALHNKNENLLGCDATFQGFYSPAYELSLENYENRTMTRLTEESFDYGHLGLLNPIFDMAFRDKKMLGNIEAVYIFQVVFYSSRFLTDYNNLSINIIYRKNDPNYPIYSNYKKRANMVNYKGFFIFPFVLYPFLATHSIFRESFSKKYDRLSVDIEKRWYGEDHKNFNIKMKEIFMIEASSDIIKTMHQLYLSTFPESEPHDLFFSHFNYFLRVFLKGILLDLSILLNELNVSWLTVINPLMSYIKGCLQIGNKTSAGTLPQLIIESLMSLQTYMQEVINIIITDNEKWKGVKENIPRSSRIISAAGYQQIYLPFDNFFVEYCLNLGDQYYDTSRRDLVDFLEHYLARCVVEYIFNNCRIHIKSKKF